VERSQDKQKKLITFRHYVQNHYPWLRLLFVPAACTDLAQPADRGFISWLKAHMRKYYTTIISTEVMWRHAPVGCWSQCGYHKN
jgi:hypothetical protein